MTKIAVDIDSTLYDFETPFRQAFLDLALESGVKEYFRGGYQSWVEWRSPTDVCGIEAFLQALDVVHSPEIIISREPYEHSQEVLTDLVDQGYDLLFISNRNPDVQGVTEEWLRERQFPEGELICTMLDKTPYMAQCQYLIDDRPKTLVDFVYTGWDGGHHSGCPDSCCEHLNRKAFGLLFEYNRALTDINNIYLAPTWAGIRYYLEEKGVLSGSRRSVSVGS